MKLLPHVATILAPFILAQRSSALNAMFTDNDCDIGPDDTYYYMDSYGDDKCCYNIGSGVSVSSDKFKCSVPQRPISCGYYYHAEGGTTFANCSTSSSFQADAMSVDIAVTPTDTRALNDPILNDSILPIRLAIQYDIG